MIEYKHVALRYTDKNILKDVNLRIENGGNASRTMMNGSYVSVPAMSFKPLPYFLT